VILLLADERTRQTPFVTPYIHYQRQQQQHGDAEDKLTRTSLYQVMMWPESGAGRSAEEERTCRSDARTHN